MSMAEATAKDIDQTLMAVANEHVIVCRVEEVRAYFFEFPDVLGVLLDAVRAARAHLPEAELHLDVYHDPEIDDRFLVLCARLQRYEGDVMRRIEAAESEFLPLLTDKRGWVQLTTDFKADGACAPS